MVRDSEKPVPASTPKRRVPVVLGAIAVFVMVFALVVVAGSSVMKIVLWAGLSVCMFMASVFLVRAAFTWTLVTDVRRVRFSSLLRKLSDPAERDPADVAEVHYYDAAAQRVDSDLGAQVAYAVTSVADSDGYGVYAVHRAEGALVDPAGRSQSKAASSDDVIWDFMSEVHCDTETPDSDRQSAADGEIVHVAMYVDGIRIPKRPSRKGLRLSKVRVAVFRTADFFARPVVAKLSRIRLLDDVVIAREEPTSAPRRTATICSGVVAALATGFMVNGHFIEKVVAAVVVGLAVAGAVWLGTCNHSVRFRQVARERASVIARSTGGRVAVGVTAVALIPVAIVLVLAALVTWSLMFAVVAAAAVAVICAAVKSLDKNRVGRHGHEGTVAKPPALRLDIRSQAAALMFIIGAVVLSGFVGG